VSIAAPQGATHARYIACSAEIDFESSSLKANDAVSAFVTLNNSPQTAITLDLDVMVNAAKPILIGVGLEFYQEVNGQKYLLQNGQFNPFQIVTVDTGVVHRMTQKASDELAFFYAHFSVIYTHFTVG